jgi:hypothetical protein
MSNARGRAAPLLSLAHQILIENESIEQESYFEAIGAKPAVYVSSLGLHKGAPLLAGELLGVSALTVRGADAKRAHSRLGMGRLLVAGVRRPPCA